MTDDRARGLPDDPARALIESLATDLAPIRPLPPLRRVVGALALVWAVVAGLGLAWLGARPDLAEAWTSGPGVAAVFVALALAGVAALAMGIPGREGLVRRGIWCAALALAGAAGLGSVLFWQAPSIVTSLENDLHCLVVAIVMGALPALGVIGFAGRAAPFRPFALTLAAAAAAASLGTVVAQAACPMPDMKHLLVGHVLAPGAGALVLTLPLGLLLRRLAASSEAAS